MATEIIRPSDTEQSTGFALVPTDSSIEVITSDADDSTYIQQTQSAGAGIEVQLGNLTATDIASIDQVVVHTRAKADRRPTATITTSLIDGDSAEIGKTINTFTQIIETDNSEEFTTQADGTTPLTETYINSLTIDIDVDTQGSIIYDLWVTVTYTPDIQPIPGTIKIETGNLQLTSGKITIPEVI